MKTEYEFGFVARLDPALTVGATPLGMRMVFTVTGGEVEGERIRGKVVGAGADWLMIGADGWGHLDVRAQVQTPDGAVLYVRYEGLIEMNDKVQQALTAPDSGSTEYADQYFRTTPRLESGDAGYAGVNHSLFVAEGRLRPGPAVEYRVYRVA